MLKRLFTFETKGKNLRCSWQKEKSQILAIGGSQVSLLDRKGQLIETVEGECVNLSWTRDGSTLAIIQKSSNILLWSAAGCVSIDSSLKYMDVCDWSEGDIVTHY